MLFLLKLTRAAIFHCMIEDNGRGFQGAEINTDHKRPLSTIINQERLAILSRQTKTVTQLTIVDKKATVGERGVQVELILPFQLQAVNSGGSNPFLSADK